MVVTATGAGRSRRVLLLVLTVIHQEAKFLDHSQVAGHSVDAVSLQACKRATRQLLL